MLPKASAFATNRSMFDNKHMRLIPGSLAPQIESPCAEAEEEAAAEDLQLHEQ